MTDELERGIEHPKQLLVYKVGNEQKVTLRTIEEKLRKEKEKLGQEAIEEEEV